MTKKSAVLLFFLVLLLPRIFSQTGEQFRIDSVEYSITGATREHPLRKAVKIDKNKVFTDKTLFDHYLEDLRSQFYNLRVLESSSVEPTYGQPDAAGIIPVHLTVTTKDTLNIIALPKPGFDSNTGFELKLKLKNYNFFGSMQELDSDVNYELDEDGNHSISGGVSFSIPFEAWGYSFAWDIQSEVTIPFGHPVMFDVSTGLDLEIPVSFFEVHFGIVQSMAINVRDDDKVFYDGDELYFTEKFYINVPITLARYGTTGEIVWKPEVSFETNWDFDGIRNDDLKGPEIVLGHSLSAGRINWTGNFREGYASSLGNTYTFNFHEDKDTEIKFTGSLQGHYSFFDRIGFSSRLSGFYNLYEYISEKQGDKLRGILDKRINTDSGIFINIDIPVRIMRVNFEEITGVSWTRYIGFEMHVSPFFDMALTHDLMNDTQYSFKDGWYAGGLEIIVYPLKMRSIYARASVGFDLAEVLESGSLGGDAERDGESIRELFIGIGLYY